LNSFVGFISDFNFASTVELTILEVAHIFAWDGALIRSPRQSRFLAFIFAINEYALVLEVFARILSGVKRVNFALNAALVDITICKIEATFDHVVVQPKSFVRTAVLELLDSLAISLLLLIHLTFVGHVSGVSKRHLLTLSRKVLD